MEDKLLTNIITTSPCFFNPDTSMIKSVLHSLIPLNILNYPTYITCDGYVVKDFHQLKKGLITKEMIEKYEGFKANLQSLIETDEQIKKFSHNIKLLHFTDRYGFAYAVKNAIETENIKTKYVMIIQHDWIFVEDKINIDNFIEIMEKSSDINYIGFVSDSTEKYIPFFKCCFTNDRKRIVSSNEDLFHKDHPNLVKLNFWYDRNHIARTDYYMDHIFKLINEKDGKPLVRNFFEDTFGHYEMNEMKIFGIEAHKRFGNYLYYPILENTQDHSKIVVKHLNGRKFLPSDEQERLKKIMTVQNFFWKEEFENPKSLKYAFKKICFDHADLCEKVIEYGEIHINDPDRSIHQIFDFIKEKDEKIFDHLFEVYTLEKNNWELSKITVQD